MKKKPKESMRVALNGARGKRAGTGCSRIKADTNMCIPTRTTLKVWGFCADEEERHIPVDGAAVAGMSDETL